MILLSDLMPLTREDSDSTMLCASFPENLAIRRQRLPQSQHTNMVSLSYGHSVLPACCDWMSQDQSRRCRYPAPPVTRAPSLCLNHILHWFHQTCQFLMAKIPRHIRLIQTPRVIKLHQMAKIPPAVINRIRIVNLVWGQDRRIRSAWRATLLEGLSSGKNPS
ncbi:hypothetical protein P692DRAFT_20846462 [Suillus brevipes Sb2]|nr:hypothetical protein P692DRAFT_20846462 [Suillus brevipes Sb2]